MEEDPLAGHPVLRTIRVLGRSGSNVVVLASNTATGQLVAVKLIPRGFDSHQAKYLLRELLNHYELSLAKHPHIVSLLDCFLTPRHLAIVMEYIDGENLQVFLEKAGGCVIEPLARFLFQQLVIALDFCHRRGKVHRNIKPSGLLLQLSDSALPLLKMADFSVCKDTLRNSEPRSQVGTAMYCAPEVLQNFAGAPYDAAAADMWSVGVVLFMLLFGRHPFSRPEDSALSAQQQVIAMFKRVTAPPGSYDGDLFIPHALPTSVLPGAQPGAPLSLAGADMLRGLLARDPRVRMSLAAVQLHEWFRTGLPEGAALLNEVVAAEEAAAGAAAIMPPAVAAQLERMVVLAAAGPVTAGLPGREPSARHESGGAGGGSGGGGSGGGSSGGGAALMRNDLSYDPSGGPNSASAQQPQHPPPQGPLVYRTVTTTGSSDAAVQSVSIGSTVAGSVPAPLEEPSSQTLLEAAAAAAAVGGGDGAVAAMAGAPSGLLLSPHWSPVGSTSGRNGANGGLGGGEGADLLADLEAMVMGIPDDDILTAASLDFLMAASVLQQQQGHPGQPPPQGQQYDQPQQPQQPQQQQQPRPSAGLEQQQHQSPDSQGYPCGQPHGLPSQQGAQQQQQRQVTSSSLHPDNHSAPVSTDNTNGCTTTTTFPSPPHPSPPTTTQHHPAFDAPLAATAAAAPPRPSDAGAHVVPQTLTELMRPPGTTPGTTTTTHGSHGTPHAFGGAGDAPHRPADPSPPHPPPPPPPPRLQLFTSLHSAAAAAAAAGDIAAGLLQRLNTESLPSPTTLAVVDAQPFLAQGPGALGGWNDRRNSSMATIPSTYSMDWCTLSARSQTLLSPPKLAPGSNGTGSGAGSSGGGADGGGAQPSSLMQSSLWHRICNEARGTLSGVANDAKELGRAAAAGLGVRR